jgi:Kef-type K+ transport system membrane component KefB
VSIFFELAVVICLAAALAIIFRILKQPLILAYILTGILLGPVGLIHLGNGEVMSAMGELGITLLLFVLGLELRFSELRLVGKVAIIGGFIQVVYTFLLGFVFSQLLGYSIVSSIYIAIAISFSSTIIVVKLLSDKKDLHSLYGKISVGILLVQDFLAIITLIVLSGFQHSGASLSLMPFVWLFIKGVVLFGVVAVLSKTVFPKAIDYIAGSEEALFLGSLAFALGMAALVSSKYIGFSLEIGGLVAGLALANASSSMQIVARVRALRDFFITIFFVFLGTQMVFTNIASLLPSVIILTAIVLLYKPFIILTSLGLLGYRKRTSFFTAVNLAQVSEFSLIVVFLGQRIGQIPSSVVSLVTITAVVSYVVSNYLISHLNSIYKGYQHYFDLFESEHVHKDHIGTSLKLTNHIVLIGAHRIGSNILDALEDLEAEVLVIDFNPEVIALLKKRENIQSLFGDISDKEIQEHAQLETAKLIISTIPNMEDNLFLLDALKETKTKIVVLAQSSEDAKFLYKMGADYVLLPHLLGGKHIVKILRSDDMDSLEELRRKDEKYL